MKDLLKVAAVNWKVRKIDHEEEFYSHLESLVEKCASQNVQLAVFPELNILELVPLLNYKRKCDLPGQILPMLQKYEETLEILSARHRLIIVGGSHFRKEENGLVNASMIAFPDGSKYFQTKNVLTQWEVDPWGLIPGKGIRRLKDPRISVTICYDSEFPESGRHLSEAGALVHCVPSYTETVRGYGRVRWCCLARAIENQVFVIHSALVGDIYPPTGELSPTYGSSAVIAPCIDEFPENGILAETPLNEEGIAVAELDFPLLEKSRNSGDVRNWHDRSAGDWTVS